MRMGVNAPCLAEHRVALTMFDGEVIPYGQNP